MRSQNYEMRAGADDTQSGRHILKVGIPFRITEILKAWAELGETTILRMSKQSIGCAIQKKDRGELTPTGDH